MLDKAAPTMTPTTASVFTTISSAPATDTTNATEAMEVDEGVEPLELNFFADLLGHGAPPSHRRLHHPRRSRCARPRTSPPCRWCQRRRRRHRPTIYNAPSPRSMLHVGCDIGPHDGLSCTMSFHDGHDDMMRIARQHCMMGMMVMVRMLTTASVCMLLDDSTRGDFNRRGSA